MCRVEVSGGSLDQPVVRSNYSANYPVLAPTKFSCAAQEIGFSKKPSLYGGVQVLGGLSLAQIRPDSLFSFLENFGWSGPSQVFKFELN
jgi:hypothetical protein